MLDYRGFGKSTGHITSEAQLHADVRAAWARVAPAYAGKPVVILGRSLGSGLATDQIGAEQAEFRFGGPNDPALVLDPTDADVQYVLMPLRV